MVVSIISTPFAVADRPNVIVIVADDLGWNAVGYHNKEFKTPHIDSIASGGMRLNRFYVAPMCSPTRAGLMTGRYPIRFGLARAVIPPYRDHGLSTSETTLPEVLEEIDYAKRGVFGKWHLGHRRSKWHPLNQGFTHFYGHYNGAIDYFDLTREGVRDWHVGDQPSSDHGYATDLIADAAAEWIQHAATGQSPYFAYVPFNAPHSPFQAPQDAIDRYGNVTVENRGDKNREIYRAMVGRMDEGIGRILDAIDATGEADNTLVWFFSDNGGVGSLKDLNVPLRGAKLSTFEGGIRVPACVRWPAKISPGQTSDIVCGYIDVMPTLMSVAQAASLSGVSPKAGSQPALLKFDGIDLSPIFAGAPDDSFSRSWYSYHGQPGPLKECLSIHEGGWKLIVNGPRLRNLRQLHDDQHDVHLFHLADDPNETTNLAGEHPQRLEALAKRLIQHRNLQPNNAVPPYRNGKAGFVPPPNWQLDVHHPNQLVGHHE